MPNEISNAISSIPIIGGPAVNAANTIGSDFEGLYNALPSPSALFGESSSTPATPSSGPSTPALTTTPPTITAPPATPAPIATPAPNTGGGSSLYASGTTPGATPAITPNPSGAVPVPPKSAASSLGSLGTLVSVIGNALEMYNRYNLQQNLENPNFVSGQIAQMQQPLSKNLKNAVGQGVQAQMQEAGLGQAPGLFRQALAQALAPYQQEEQARAAQEYYDALNEANAAYPVDGGLSDFGQLIKALYSNQGTAP